MDGKALNRRGAAVAAIILGIFSARAPAAPTLLPPINRAPSSLRTAGRFIWADLFTSDVASAGAFYAGLLNWHSAPVVFNGRTYLIMSNGDRAVAGLVERRRTADQRPAVWVGYISVRDVPGTLASVQADGGKVRAPARAFPDRGTQAILTDPEGAVVGILASSTGDPSDDEPAPGEWDWFELYTRNAPSSSDFYRRVVGYEVTSDTRAGKSDHLRLASDGHPRGGVAPLAASPDSRAGWLGFVRVESIDDAVNTAVNLGGHVEVPPKAAALGSRFAIVSDPTGGTIGLVQFTEGENPAERR